MPVRRYRIEGRVQGVGFRAFVWREARRLGITGWVRNRADASVEVVAQASEAEHALFSECLHSGPRFAQVVRVSCVDEGDDHGLGPGFDIVGGG